MKWDTGRGGYESCQKAWCPRFPPAGCGLALRVCGPSYHRGIGRLCLRLEQLPEREVKRKSRDVDSRRAAGSPRGSPSAFLALTPRSALVCGSCLLLLSPSLFSIPLPYPRSQGHLKGALWSPGSTHSRMQVSGQRGGHTFYVCKL